MIWFYKIPYLHYICLWVVCLYSLWKKSFWLWQVFPYKWHKKCHKWMKSNWNYIWFFYLHKFRLYLDLELRHQRFCLTRICKGPHKGRRMRSLWRLPIKIITINSKKKTQWAKKIPKKSISGGKITKIIASNNVWIRNITYWHFLRHYFPIFIALCLGIAVYIRELWTLYCWMRYMCHFNN